jgi:hypothetical protein
MPNTAIAHRAGIGNFYPVLMFILRKWSVGEKGKKGKKSKLKSNLRGELNTWFICVTLAVLYCLFVTILLQCMDVESNPGPDPEIESRFSQILYSLHMQGMGLSQQMFEHFQSLSHSLSKIQHELCQMKRDIKQNRSDISELQQNSVYVQEQLDRLELKLERLDTNAREKNLVFFGVYEPGPREGHDDTDEIVAVLNNNSSHRWTRDDIEKTQRLGQPSRANWASRALVVTFCRMQDKTNILKDSALRSALRQYSIRVSADLTQRQRDQLQQLREEGKVAYYKNGRLHVEGRHQETPRDHGHHASSQSEKQPAPHDHSTEPHFGGTTRHITSTSGPRVGNHSTEALQDSTYSDVVRSGLSSNSMNDFANTHQQHDYSFSNIATQPVSHQWQAPPGYPAAPPGFFQLPWTDSAQWPAMPPRRPKEPPHQPTGGLSVPKSSKTHNHSQNTPKSPIRTQLSPRQDRSRRHESTHDSPHMHGEETLSVQQNNNAEKGTELQINPPETIQDQPVKSANVDNNNVAAAAAATADTLSDNAYPSSHEISEESLDTESEPEFEEALDDNLARAELTREEHVEEEEAYHINLPESEVSSTIPNQAHDGDNEEGQENAQPGLAAAQEPIIPNQNEPSANGSQPEADAAQTATAQLGPGARPKTQTARKRTVSETRAPSTRVLRDRNRSNSRDSSSSIRSRAGGHTTQSQLPAGWRQANPQQK